VTCRVGNTDRVRLVGGQVIDELVKEMVAPVLGMPRAENSH